VTALQQPQQQPQTVPMDAETERGWNAWLDARVIDHLKDFDEDINEDFRILQKEINDLRAEIALQKEIAKLRSEVETLRTKVSTAAVHHD
jgi:archaellum component FlaC